MQKKNSQNPFWKDKKILIKLGLLVGIVAYSFSFLTSCDQEGCSYFALKLDDSSAVKDLDGDGVFDKYDMDMDGDTIWDWNDADIDNDGLLNAYDDDIDNDGVKNDDDYDADADNIELHVAGDCHDSKGDCGGSFDDVYLNDSEHEKFYIEGKSQADADHDDEPYTPFDGLVVNVVETTTLADTIPQEVVTTGQKVLTFSETIDFTKVRKKLEDENVIIERTVIEQITVGNNTSSFGETSTQFLTANANIDCVLRIYYQCHWGDSLGEKYLALSTITKEAAAVTGQPIEKLGNFATETLALLPEEGARLGLYWIAPGNKGFDLDFKTRTVDSCGIIFEFTFEQPLVTAGTIMFDFNIDLAGKAPHN